MTREEIGQIIINFIIESSLVSVDTPEGAVMVWSANAASQLGEMIYRDILKEQTP